MMKKTFMALALTLLPFGMASAQVRMLVVPKDGTAPKSFNLDDIRRIDFLGEANTFSIACATDRWSYEFDKVRCLKFDGLVNDIATATKQESAVSIAYREGQIFVSGFLLKPANEADVRNVLEHLRYPPENAPVGIKIQCFGNFEIFVGGRALAFKRSKSKELLAYLVDRNGATCTNGEMLAVLWEDKPDTASLHSHLRNLIFDLSHTLEDAGVNGLLVRGRSTLALDTSKVDCDYYNFLRGDRSAFNSYRGEYMTQYSWAEVTRSALRQQAAATPKSGSIPSYYVPPTGF